MDGVSEEEQQINSAMKRDGYLALRLDVLMTQEVCVG